MGKLVKLQDLKKDLFVLDFEDMKKIKGGSKRSFFWFGGWGGMVPH